MAEQLNLPYEPDFVSPPGDTILELLEERGMTQSELAQRMGRPVKTINEIIHGKAMLTPETALQLEKVLGTPARLWLALEHNYREHLARQAEDESLQAHKGWLDNFPVKEMQKCRWLPQEKDKSRQLFTLLRFFGLATPDSWEDIWAKNLVNFRKTAAFQSSDYALSAWLRQGELKAQNIPTCPYDKAAFRSLLNNEIRSLTCDRSGGFDQLVDLCANVGVAVVFVPQLREARVSGAARWLSPQKALIQLSLRYKRDDQFWFSFYHEAGHILQHGKRDIFIHLGEKGEGGKEEDADDFAADTLIPRREYEHFVHGCEYFSKENVKRFADEIGVAPGIVVGRLQYDRHLPHSHLNDLKVKYEWERSEAV
jgi:HTH-type transcriptional regulator / antitoxin HigA